MPRQRWSCSQEWPQWCCATWSLLQSLHSSSRCCFCAFAVLCRAMWCRVLPPGHVITNYHVITDASDIQVTFMGGTEYSAKVVGFDQDKDIAVLKVSCLSVGSVFTTIFLFSFNIWVPATFSLPPSAWFDDWQALHQGRTRLASTQQRFPLDPPFHTLCLPACLPARSWVMLPPSWHLRRTAPRPPPPQPTWPPTASSPSAGAATALTSW